VLFCDFVNFTQYSESQPAETVLSHLGPLIECFEQLAVQFQLEKIKTISDSFMATAALNHAMENPALNCALCGLEMVKAACEMPLHWEVGVGVHVGSIVAGIVGRLNYQYDAWGDTVNTAARMAESATPSKACVNVDTWNHLRAHLNATPRGLICVKGKGDQEVFELSYR